MLLIFVIADSNLFAAKLTKHLLVFKGMQNAGGISKLVFADKKNKIYLFRAKGSHTEPFVFFSTAVDGSLNENQKIMGKWFWVSYRNLRVGQFPEKIIIEVTAITALNQQPSLYLPAYFINYLK